MIKCKLDDTKKYDEEEYLKWRNGRKIIIIKIERKIINKKVVKFLKYHEVSLSLSFPFSHTQPKENHCRAINFFIVVILGKCLLFFIQSLLFSPSFRCAQLRHTWCLQTYNNKKLHPWDVDAESKSGANFFMGRNFCSWTAKCLKVGRQAIKFMKMKHQQKFLSG